jgi:predicted transcriptional regulator
MAKLNSTAKLVHIHLQTIADSVGTKELFNTNSELGSLIERGNREVTRALTSLEEAGFIKVDIDSRRQPIRIITLL